MTAGTRTIWLVTVEAHDGGSPGEVSLYYSDSGYTSRPSDTPANTWFDGRVISPGSISRSIFAGGTTFGRIDVGYGAIRLGNADGALDALRSYGWGRRVTVRSITARLPEREAFSAAVVRFAGVVSHVEADFDEIRLILRDELGRLDVPLQESEFAGTSTGATGIEGNGNIEGQLKPMAWGGALRNITPALVNASKECRGWRFDKSGAVLPSASVDALRNGGAPYTLSGTDHADRATLFAASVPAAEADTSLAESLLRTSGSITAQITADVTVAPQVTNLLTYSAALDNAAWSKTRAGVTADAAAAPDGTTAADRIVEDATAAATHELAQAATIAAGAAVVASVYLAADTRTRARVTVSGASGSLYVDADLAAGTVSSATATGSYSGATAEIEAAGDFWRVSVLGTTATDTSVSLVINLADSGGAVSYDGDGVSGLYAWGAMLSAGTAVAAYIATTSATVTLRPAASAARIAEAVLAEHGFTIDPESVLALDAANAAPCGLYVDGPGTVLEAAQRALESIGGYLIATNTGAFKVGRFEAPAGPVRKAITDPLDDGPARLDLVPTDDGNTGRPAYKVVLNYALNFTPQDADALTGSVSADDREKWRALAQKVTAEDLSVRDKHPEARVIEIDTLLETEAAATAEAARRLAFLKSDLTRFRLPLPARLAVWDSDGATPLDIGDRVTVALDRFGLEAATDFVVIGVDEDFEGNVVTLDIVNSSAW